MVDLANLLPREWPSLMCLPYIREVTHSFLTTLQIGGGMQIPASRHGQTHCPSLSWPLLLRPLFHLETRLPYTTRGRTPSVSDQDRQGRRRLGPSHLLTLQLAPGGAALTMGSLPWLLSLKSKHSPPTASSRKAGRREIVAKERLTLSRS